MDLHPNWVALSTVYIPWKRFVSEKEIVEKTNKISKNKEDRERPENGKAVKDFYLELVSNNKETYNEKKLSPSKIGNSPKSKQLETFDPSERTVSKFLLAAQNNNVVDLKEIFSMCPKIVNCMDSFGWTALMCAVQSKALGSIRYLLTIGADKSIEDKNGRTAFSLARSQEVVYLLSESKNITQKIKHNGNPTVESMFCECCQVHYNSNEEKQHKTSTLHVFSSNKKKFPTYYGIPESNKGFQILLKKGWDKEVGLGPDGSGSKFPLRTALKTDRLGLGSKPYDSKVTHFSARDISAINSRRERQQTLNKRQRVQKMNKEKMFERMLRNEFS